MLICSSLALYDKAGMNIPLVIVIALVAALGAALGALQVIRRSRAARAAV